MYVSSHSSQPRNSENIFLLSTSQGVEIIDCSSLVRIEAISNYCKLFFATGKTLVVAKVLAWFEERLSAKGFVRLHRSHLVNMQYILRLNDEKRTEVILKNYYSIPVSRRKKQQCRQAILQFYTARAASAIAA
jgi:two-component system LytT family response regulator